MIPISSSQKECKRRTIYKIVSVSKHGQIQYYHPYHTPSFKRIYLRGEYSVPLQIEDHDPIFSQNIIFLNTVSYSKKKFEWSVNNHNFPSSLVACDSKSIPLELSFCLIHAICLGVTFAKPAPNSSSEKVES